MMIEKSKNFYKRKCIATSEILDVDKLIRFTYDKEKELVVLDLNKDKKGRGCYLKNDLETWELVIRKKAFNRTFRAKITTENYAQLYKQLQEKLWQKK